MEWGRTSKINLFNVDCFMFLDYIHYIRCGMCIIIERFLSIINFFDLFVGKLGMPNPLLIASIHWHIYCLQIPGRWYISWVYSIVQTYQKIRICCIKTFASWDCRLLNARVGICSTLPRKFDGYWLDWHSVNKKVNQAVSFSIHIEYRG